MADDVPEGQTREQRRQVLVTRRAFLLDLGWLGLAVIFFGGALSTLVRYLTPPRRAASLTEMKKVGNTRDLPEAQALLATLGSVSVAVVNVHGQISAFDRRCTHFACLVDWIPDTVTFKCPCHQGRFDASGNVISGPPPRPLKQLKTRVDEEGSIFIGTA